MENVADALRMAFGVIIAIILTAMLIGVFNVISNSEDAREQQILEKEINEYNQKFLAFQKSSMYGTDLISVIGLAISNNKICNQANSANPDGTYNADIPSSINIGFQLRTPVSNKVEIYEYKSTETNSMTGTPTRENGWVLTESSNNTELFHANRLYTISEDESNKANYDNIASMALSMAEYTESPDHNGRRITRTYNNGFKDLETRVFECDLIEYDASGRVNYMHFMEKDVD